MTTKQYTPYSLSKINPKYGVGVVDAFFRVACHDAMTPRQSTSGYRIYQSNVFGPECYYRDDDGGQKLYVPKTSPKLSLDQVISDYRSLTINYGDRAMYFNNLDQIVDNIITFSPVVFGALTEPSPSDEYVRYNTADMIEVYFELLLRRLAVSHNSELITHSELSLALQAYFTLGNWAAQFCDNTLVFTEHGERVLSFTHPVNGPTVMVLSDNGHCANLLIEYREGGSIRTTSSSQSRIVEMLATVVSDLLNGVPEEEAV